MAWRDDETRSEALEAIKRIIEGMNPMALPASGRDSRGLVMLDVVRLNNETPPMSKLAASTNQYEAR